MAVRKGVIKPKEWKSLDQISNAAKSHHRREEHVVEKLSRFGEDWMVCNDSVCTEYSKLFDEFIVNDDKRLKREAKRREKRSEETNRPT